MVFWIFQIAISSTFSQQLDAVSLKCHIKYKLKILITYLQPGVLVLNSCVLNIPNVLGASCDNIEEFYTAVVSAKEAEQYSFDMSAVNFVQPHGVMALLNAGRILGERNKRPVQLNNLQHKVHLYLERTDLLIADNNTLFVSSPLLQTWTRGGSQTMLELTHLESEKNLDKIVDKAYSLFEINMGEFIAGLVVKVLHELCANVIEHSSDLAGAVLIQKCKHPSDQNVICIRVAVSDLGIGIQRSLQEKYSNIDDPAKALDAVINGQTSRKKGRGGLGIRSVGDLAKQQGGYLWIRSDTAALSYGKRPHTNLTPVRGTQVEVELRIKNTRLPVDCD